MKIWKDSINRIFQNFFSTPFDDFFGNSPFQPFTPFMSGNPKITVIRMKPILKTIPIDVDTQNEPVENDTL